MEVLMGTMIQPLFILPRNLITDYSEAEKELDRQTAIG